MKRPSYHRILAALSPLALVLAVMAGAFLNDSAQARPTHGYFYVYFSDASKTTAVGWKNYDCDGTVTHGGTTSPYYGVDVFDCY
jgi:hypothetical protein